MANGGTMEREDLYHTTLHSFTSLDMDTLSVAFSWPFLLFYSHCGISDPNQQTPANKK